MSGKKLWFLLLVPLLVALQSADLELRLSRDWGYGGLDNRIQGRFSLHASGPEDLVEVQFRMDDAIIHKDADAPFSYQFETDQFDIGQHTMRATGVLSDGTEIESRVIVRVFLSAEEARGETMGIVVPLLVVVGLITLLGVAGPLLFGRKRVHRPGVYGPAGGAVCSRCEMPFSRSVLAPNILVGKLERCPHCGKWAIAPRASLSALEAAEARFVGQGGQTAEDFETEEGKRRRLLDESRFDN